MFAGRGRSKAAHLPRIIRALPKDSTAASDYRDASPVAAKVSPVSSASVKKTTVFPGLTRRIGTSLRRLL
jgi:hypothetical protein